MKKVALFMALFTMVTLSAKAQWFNLSNNMNDVTIGLNLAPLAMISMAAKSTTPIMVSALEQVFHY
jgi:hypothetical protein